MDRTLYNLDPLLQPIAGDEAQNGFVENFFRLIDETIDPPYAISLDGLWGTGKTTVMKLLQSRVEENGYPVFWFNPWEYRQAESIVLAFLQCLAAAHKDLLPEIRLKGKTFLHVLLESGMDVGLQLLSKGNLSLSGVKESFKDAEQANLALHETYRNTVEAIKEEFLELTLRISQKHGDKAVIMFIDDLDRCLPDDSIQILEALKNFFVTGRGKTIFVCGIDTHIAKQFIASHYQGIEEDFSINYFRKIFNLTISMPYSLNMEKLLLEKIKQIYSWQHPSKEKQATELARMVFILGLQTKIYSIRKYLNIIINYFVFLRFNPQYQYTGGKDFILTLMVLKEAWQPLFENIVKEALREKSDTGNIVEKMLKKDSQTTFLSVEQREYLQDYLGINSEFSDYNLCEWIADYPTIA